MIELYKVITGIYDEDVSNFVRTRDDSTRAHKYKLHKTHSRLYVRKYPFTQIIVEPLNNLPPSVITTPTII
jgi:hypothetical protein